MVALGDICSNELQNTDEALKWYLSAAELGSLEAKKACAAIYSYNTKNTKANYRLAIEYYQMVIDQEGKEKSEDFQYRVDRYKKVIENLKLKIED